MTAPIALLVDADQILSESLAYLLDQAGYEVHMVTSGEEALDYVEQKNPYIIVMDLLLEGMDGYRLLNLIHNSPYDPSVFVWTHLSHDEDKASAKSYPIKGYFIKSSTSVNTLSRKLSKLI